MRKRKNDAGTVERHYGFQRFNLIRRMTREWIVSGYRDYTEYTFQAESTYSDQVELISHALSPYVKWREDENKTIQVEDKRVGKIQIEDMRVGRNPLYLLLKSRSMKSGMNYFLHFALLEMLRNENALSLAEIQHKLGSGFSLAEADRMEIPTESLETFLPADPYSYAEYDMQRKLEMRLEHFAKGETAIINRGKDNKYRRRKDAAENISMHPSDLAVAMMYILSGNKAFSINEVQKELEKKMTRFLNRYGYKGAIRKTTLLNRLESHYIPANFIKKNEETKKYSLVSHDIDEMLKCYPRLKRAIAFYAEHSPLGIIGSCLMDTYGFEDNSIVFKDEYIVQALDTIVLYDVLLAIQNNHGIEAYMEQISKTVLEKRKILPLKVLVCAGDGRRYIFSYDLDKCEYCNLRLDFIHDVFPFEINSDKLQIEQIRKIGAKKLEYIWTAFVGGSVFPVRVWMHNKRQTFAQEITRERRMGEIFIKENGIVQFASKVYHPRELVPWLLSHTGDVVALEVETDENGNRDSSRMLNRYREHIHALHEMYHGNGEPRDISEYIASSEMHAWYGKLSCEQSECFDYIWKNRQKIVSEERLDRKRTSEEKQVRRSSEGKLKRKSMLRDSLRALICEARKKCNIEIEDDNVNEDELLLYQRLICTKKILRQLRMPRTKNELISIIVQSKKELDIENDDTITFENFKVKGLLKRPVKYPPVDEKKLKGIRTSEDSSPLFHAFRSKYIGCMNYVLTQVAKPLTKDEIEDIIVLAKKKYGINDKDMEVSFENLYGSGMIQEYSVHTGLMGVSTSEEDRYCSYLLDTNDERMLPCPMLPHEEDWLRTILEDQKINLFLTRDEVKEIKAKLGQGPVLYSSDDIIFLDRHKDGDDFSDPQYQKVFSILQEKILSNADEVKLWYQTEKEKQAGTPAILYHIKPLRLEYSRLSDKTTLIGMFAQEPPERSTLIERNDSGCLYLRLSNILKVEENESKSTYTILYEEAICEEPLIIRLYNIYGAVERFMLMLSMYKKEVLYEADTDTCLTMVWYSKRDEEEVLKRIRSLGRAVEVLEPSKIRKEITKLVDRQYERISEW